MKKYKQKN